MFSCRVWLLAQTARRAARGAARRAAECGRAGGGGRALEGARQVHAAARTPLQLGEAQLAVELVQVVVRRVDARVHAARACQHTASGLHTVAVALLCVWGHAAGLTVCPERGQQAGEQARGRQRVAAAGQHAARQQGGVRAGHAVRGSLTHAELVEVADALLQIHLAVIRVFETLLFRQKSANGIYGVRSEEETLGPFHV